MPFTLLDVILLIVMLVSGLLAMIRGFMREVLSIAAWGIAAVTTLYAFNKLTPVVQQYINNDIIAKVVTVAGVFLGTLLLVTIVTVRISDMILDSRVGALDRTLGFLFFAWLVPDNRQPDWVQSAKSKVVLQGTGNWLIGMLPEDPETTILKRLKKPKPEDQESDAPGQKSESGAPATTTGTRAQ